MMSETWWLDLDRPMAARLIDQLNETFTVWSPSRGSSTGPALMVQPASTDKINSSKSPLPPSSVILPHLYNERPQQKRGRCHLLFGLSREDVVGISCLDKFMGEPAPDPVYGHARSQYLICGLDRKGPPPTGYDLYLSPVKSRWRAFLSSGSDQKIIKLVDTLFPDARKLNSPPVKTTTLLPAPYKILENANLSTAIIKSKGRRIWKDVANRCLGCGICAFVCPLCFCFDHDHSIDLSGKTKKCRTWDSCMLAGHSRVAGGHHYLPRLEDRIFNWYHHKFVRIPAEYPGYSGCIGCGRCREACPAKIDLLEVVSEVLQTYA